MVGASTPFFVCLLGFLIFHQVHHWRVYVSLVPIAGGAILSTYGEKDLNVLGFILTLLSTLLRGLKTVWQGHLLQGEERLNSPNLLRYMALDAGIILFVLFLVFESRDFASWLQSEGSDTYKLWHFALLLTLNPAAAYLANWSQFMLIQKSSALTFQVIGNTKGVINAVTGIIGMWDFIIGDSVCLFFPHFHHLGAPKLGVLSFHSTILHQHFSFRF
jgi:drug/metabolite transporter (DMT)-like permease